MFLLFGGGAVDFESPVGLASEILVAEGVWARIDDVVDGLVWLTKIHIRTAGTMVRINELRSKTQSFDIDANAAMSGCLQVGLNTLIFSLGVVRG